MTWRAILLLEHSQQATAEISAWRTERGYAVLVAGDGADAIKLTAEGPTDLLVFEALGDVSVVRVPDDCDQSTDSSDGLDLLDTFRSHLPGADVAHQQYRHGGLMIDFDGRHVVRDGQDVAVTRHELAVLAYLALHAGKRRTVAEIFEAVWGRPFSSEAAYVWTYIRRLRRKVEPDPRRPVYLSSRGGLGYFLPPPDDSANC